MEQRDRPADIEITDAMIAAGVRALASACPMDFAFPAGGEEIAVEAVLKAALAAPAIIKITGEMAKVGRDFLTRWADWADDYPPGDAIAGMPADEGAQALLRAILRAGGYEVSEEFVQVPRDEPELTERQRRLLGLKT